jgi:hypothetical protein
MLHEVELSGFLIATTTCIPQERNLVKYFNVEKSLNGRCQKGVILLLVDLIQDSITFIKIYICP